jgi:hypothetical protein
MKTYKWSYEEEITAEEFLMRLVPLVNGPVQMMWECDGDMFMSDYAKLCDAAARSCASQGIRRTSKEERRGQVNEM